MKQTVPPSCYPAAKHCGEPAWHIFEKPNGPGKNLGFPHWNGRNPRCHPKVKDTSGSTTSTPYIYSWQKRAYNMLLTHFIYEQVTKAQTFKNRYWHQKNENNKMILEKVEVIQGTK